MSALHSLRRLGGLSVALLCGGGCVTVYQPMASLQRPTAIDPRLENFKGVKIDVRCLPGDYLEPEYAEDLCGAVRALLSQQGAEVEVEVAQGGGPPGDERGGKAPDLRIDLSARRLHHASPPYLWVLSFATLTLLPAVTDVTFAQDVTVRDASGFVLAQDSLQGRFVRYLGVGVWAVNAGLDLVARSPEAKLTGDVAPREFSRDFYAQLSQLAFNARMRALVLAPEK